MPESVYRIGLGAVVDTSGAPDVPLAARAYSASIATLVTKKATTAVRHASVSTVYKFYAPPLARHGSVASLVTYVDITAQFDLSELPDIIGFELSSPLVGTPTKAATGAAATAHCRVLEIQPDPRVILVPPRQSRNRRGN